jgi:hypothetical protein
MPKWWMVSVGAAWWTGFLVALAAAVVPLRGQVLPDGNRAVTSALAVAVGLMALNALLPRDAPGHSVTIPLLIGMRNCLGFALVDSIVPVCVGLYALRRVALIGSWRIGAALGASAGALAGLILHLLCPVGGAAHLALAHAGAVVVCGLFGALVASRALR